MTSVTSDNPKLEKASQKQTDNRSLLTALFQSVEEGILVVNLEGVVENYNDQFTRLWQIPPHIIEARDDNKLLSHILVQLVSPDDFIEQVERLYHSDAVQRDKIKFIDGRTLERYTRPLIVNGKMQGRLWAFRDITDAINRELELKQHREHLTELVHDKTIELEKVRDNAVTATKTKSAFLASMSHELRTPLNSIIGFTDILREAQTGPVNGEQKEQLDIVFDSACQLLGLINNLIDISKIEAGKTVVNKMPVAIADLAHALTSLLKPQATSKGVALYATPPEDGFNVINTDNNLLRQILINLLGNAIKFTREGSVTLAWKQRDNGLVEFSVTDTGIGISPNELDTIFETFKQAESHITSHEPGSGLGLAICRHNLKLLGGEIYAKSRPEKGSTFIFTLPAGEC